MNIIAVRLVYRRIVRGIDAAEDRPGRKMLISTNGFLFLHITSGIARKFIGFGIY